MPKVDILRLDSVTSNDTAATASINTNFASLQAAVENTLSRDGTVPNYMLANLDLNSNRIINVADPVDPLDVVTLGYLNGVIGEIPTLVQRAESAAELAQNKANNAADSATAAATSSQIAQVAAADAYNYYQSMIGMDYQTKANLVTSVSAASTDEQYPSAKLFYDTCGDIETLINAL